MLRTEIPTLIQWCYMSPGGEWRWQEDEIKIAVVLRGRRNAHLRPLRLDDVRDRRMPESDGPLNRAARREEHLLSGSGRRSKWSWFHRSRQRAVHVPGKELPSSAITRRAIRSLVRRNKLSQSPEEVVEDMLAHTVTRRPPDGA
jgi:hypothetical protein